jgi:hypothetical protein
MMEINKVFSDLTFEKCAIRKIECVNDTISLPNQNARRLSLGVDTQYLGFNDDRHTAVVTLQICISVNTECDDKKTVLETTIDGFFSAPGTMGKDIFSSMAAINGAAALYSVARGKINAISSVIFSNGVIDIPFINFMDYYKELSDTRPERNKIQE